MPAMIPFEKTQDILVVLDAEKIWGDKASVFGLRHLADPF